MILFGEPLNSGKPITILPSTDTIENLMDMRRDTFYDSVASMPPSSVPVNFNIKIGDSATPPNARHFNALYLVGQNIGQFDLLNGSTSVLGGAKQPEHRHTLSDGAVLRQHFLQQFAEVSSTELTLRIISKSEAAQPFRLYLIYILRRQVYIPEDRNFTRIDMSAVDTNRVVHNSLYNIATVVPGQNSQKYAVGYVASRQGQHVTVNWRITLNSNPNPALQPSEISVTGNSVFALSGTGMTRTLILETATANLLASEITISRAGVSVTNVERVGEINVVGQMQNFRRNHPNFTICEDFDDFPERCYEAYFSNESLAWAYSTNYKPSGVNIEYAIRER